jgi:iron complex outermembrane recepter protein
MKRKKLLTSLATSIALFLSPVYAAESAGTVATGTLEGRVQDVSTGDYLNNARVTIQGTHLTTLTNQFGEYRVADVPSGQVQVTVFYSGLPTQSATLAVAPGQRVVRDFDMVSGARPGGVIQLEAFTVKAEHMSEAAFATNEQRFAPNMKTVLSAESFGDQSEGNVAEFLKFMPGLFINYVEQDARSATVRGMPSHTTIVTSNGNAVASAPTGADRTFEFEKLTINDAAQIEFNKTLLPDMPAEGIGGTINIVTKSAFQRSRPLFTYRTYINVNTTRLELRKTPGVKREPTWKMKPGFDFTYINPVSRNFGFTLSGAVSSKFNPQNLATTTWELNADPVTGVENPFLRSFTMQDTPKFTDRFSGRVGVDWRFAENSVLTLGYSQQYYDAVWMGRRWTVNSGSNPVSFSPEFTQGRPNAGSVAFTGNASHKYGTTWTPEFKYNYRGPVWKSEVRGAYSRSSTHMRTAEKGHFQQMNFTVGSFNATGGIVAPTVRLYNNRNIIPNVAAVLATGESVDPQDVNNFIVNTTTTLYREVADVKKSLFLHTQREINLGVPITIKTGGDVRQSIRDLRSQDPAYTFVGPDGRPGGPDNAVAALGALGVDLVDPYSKLAPPFGLPKFRWPSQYKLYDTYVTNPEWWTRNPAAEHIQLVANSRNLQETITSGFVRFDASFFRNRMTLVGGARFQDYRSRAEAGTVDNLGQYVRDEDGGVVINPETGGAVRVTGSALEVTERTNIERGVTTRGTTQGYYPSFNVVYRLMENVQIRAGYANSISYPNLSQLAAVTTISDLTSSPRRLTANSPLEPWFARNYDIDIEYYTPNGGSFTLAFFRKDISNFVNQIRHDVGSPGARAALEKYGYGALAPLDFEVVEFYNEGNATIDGWEFGLHHNLDSNLPSWARGLTIFANTSYTSAPTGVSASNIGSASQRLMNWGATFRRGPFATSLKWNHKPEQKRTIPNVSHRTSYTFLDVDVSYRITRRMTLFASGANVTSAPTGTYVYTPNTPDYARMRAHNVFGVQCTVGLKGQF